MKNNDKLKEFLLFVEEEISKSQVVNPREKELKQFLRIVPELLQSYVRKIISEKFNSDLQAYKATIPLFLAKFTIEHSRLCDNLILIDKKDRIKQSRKRKQTLLWACQLLKLVGKNATNVVPFAILNEYLRDLKQQEEFCKKHKVMNASGKFVSLTPPKKRKEQRNAQNYKIAKFMEQLARDKTFTFAFITLTLPPEYHPNPKKGKDSYNGSTPKQSAEKLQMYWEILRALLAKHGLRGGVDYFGMQVNEGHKDSCLHKHAMVYMKKEHLAILKEIMDGIISRERIKIAKETNRPLNKVHFRWDLKENNGKAKGSTYLFKYISPDLNNKSAVKNEALRSFYGVRSFAFFGVKNKISTFDFICKNWRAYETAIEDQEVLDMLKSKDLYLFHTKHAHKFENCHIGTGKEKKFVGVSYFPSGNREILLQKNQFVIVENEDKQDCTGIAIHNFINEEDLNRFHCNLTNAQRAFPLAQKKQKAYDDLVLEYFSNQSKKNIDNYIQKMGCYFSQTSPEVIKQYLSEELENHREIFDNTFEDTYLMEFNGFKKENELEPRLNSGDSLVILKHHYSSKTPSGFVEIRPKPNLTPEFC